MGHVTFKGGVFPHRRKRLTRDRELEEYLPKGELVYPLLQHIGGMAVPWWRWESACWRGR